MSASSVPSKDPKTKISSEMDYQSFGLARDDQHSSGSLWGPASVFLVEHKDQTGGRQRAKHRIAEEWKAEKGGAATNEPIESKQVKREPGNWLPSFLLKPCVNLSLEAQ